MEASLVMPGSMFAVVAVFDVIAWVVRLCRRES